MAEEEDAAAPQHEEHGQSGHTPQSGGNVLTHRVGPLPVWAWGAVLLGALMLYKYLHNRAQANTAGGGTVTGQNNANSLFGTEGFSVNGQGQIVDNATGAIVGTSGTGGSNNSGSGGGSWFATAQEALIQLGYDPNLVASALEDYTAGLSLPQNEYNVIESAIRLTGNPPTGVPLPVLLKPSGGGAGGGGSNNPPPGGQTNTTPQTGGPPGLSAALMNALSGNGEHIVDTVYNQYSGTWLYLTQKGGVYTEGGNGFFGSLFSFPAATFAGRTAQTIIPTPNGGYTIVDTAGETYNFGPKGSGADYATSGTPGGPALGVAVG